MDFLFEQVAFCFMNGSIPAVLYFHVSVAAIYFAALCGYNDNYRKNYTGAHEDYAGFWKFLTFWNLNFQFVFFVLSCIIDIITPECSAYNSIMKIRDTVFAGIVFPYGVLVCLMFWGIYIGNREKIFRKEDEHLFPPWLIHVSHTVILPVVVLEAFIVHHRYPGKMEGFALTLTVGVAYLLWLLYLGVVKDIWVYIFLKDLNWLEKTRLFLLSFILTFIFYVAGEQINYLFWGELQLPSLFYKMKFSIN